MNSISIIVIDPQKGFCSPTGSLASKYGNAELKKIYRALVNFQEYMCEFERCHLVKSEYSPAQFTDGDFAHELANLCVPNINEDCEIVDELKEMRFHSCVTKSQQSALLSPDFSAIIDRDLAEGIKTFVLTGFLLDHCVSSTAKDLRRYINDHDIGVIVCSDLSATRQEKYQNGIVEKAISEMKNYGIRIAPWSEIKP